MFSQEKNEAKKYSLASTLHEKREPAWGGGERGLLNVGLDPSFFYKRKKRKNSNHKKKEKHQVEKYLSPNSPIPGVTAPVAGFTPLSISLVTSFKRG